MIPSLFPSFLRFTVSPTTQGLGTSPSASPMIIPAPLLKPTELAEKCSQRRLQKSPWKNERDLHSACYLGKKQVVRHHLNIPGTNPNALDAAGLTPLHRAVWKDRYQISKMLLSKGANPTLQDTHRGRTSINDASARGSFRSLKILLQSIPSSALETALLTPDKAHRTPIQNTIQYDQPTTFDILFKAFENPETLLDHLDQNKNSLFHLASLYGRSHIMEILFRKSPWNSNHLLSKNSNHQSVLECCLFGGSSNCFSQLADKSLPWEFSDPAFSPLVASSLSVSHQSASNSDNIFSHVLQHEKDIYGADKISSRLNSIDHKGRLPLNIIAKRQLLDLIPIAIQNGADPTQTDGNGLSAFDIAKSTQNELVMSALSGQTLETQNDTSDLPSWKELKKMAIQPNPKVVQVVKKARKKKRYSDNSNDAVRARKKQAAAKAAKKAGKA